MSNLQSVILGLSIIIGFTILGAMGGEEPKEAQARASYAEQMQVDSNRTQNQLVLEKERADLEKTLKLLERGKPQILQIGDREILVSTVWNKREGGFNLTTAYYELRDDKLVQVPLTDIDDEQ